MERSEFLSFATGVGAVDGWLPLRLEGENMRRVPRCRVSPWQVVAAWLIVCLLPSFSDLRLSAEEPVQRFLQRLKEEQLFDLALAYLEQLESNPRLSPRLRADLDLEKGLLQYQAAAMLPASASNREEKLDASADLITEFLENRPNHPRRGEARLKLGELLLSRAEEAKVEADPDRDNEQAIEFFDRAHLHFERTIEELASILERIKGAQTSLNDQAQAAYRQKLRQDLRQAQLLSAKSVEERGRSRADGSPKQKSDLQQALQMFSDLYQKEQRRVAVRNYALYYRSQIQVALDRKDDAIDGFQRIADLGSIDVLRPLQTSAILELTKLLTEQGKFAVAVDRAEAWIADLRPDESEAPESLALQIQLAKTRIAWSENLREEDPENRVAKRLINNTRNELRGLLRIPGAHLDETRDLLAELGFEATVPEPGDELPEVKEFSEALAAAQERIEQAEQKSLDLELQRESGEGDWQPLEEAVRATRNQAIQLLQTAISLYTPDESREQLSDAQFRLAYLLLKQQEFWEALSLAELLSKQNAGTDQGLRAAAIALNALGDLLQSAGPSAKSGLIKQLEPFAEYLLRVWPNSTEASAAASAVVQLSLAEGNVEQAELFLSQLPDSNPLVCRLQQQLGIQLFRDYLAAEKGSDTEPEQLEQLKAKAIASLENGCNSLTKDNLDSRAIEALNALAGMYLLEDRTAKAAEVMLEGEASPMTALQQNPKLASPRIAMNSYRVALRIAINQLAEGKLDSSAAIAQTQAYVQTLQNLASEMEDGNQVLAGIFVGLARDVKSQMEEIKEPGKRRRLAEALVLIAAQAGKADSFNARYWAADTLISTAQELSGQSQARAVAMRAYLSASEILSSTLEREKQQPGWITPAEYQTQIHLQLAKSRRGLGEFKAALDELTGLLKKNPGLLTVQIEAARTYQAWGDAVNSGFHKAACIGGRYDKASGQKLVWGWGKLAQKVVGREEFEEQFYLARYELAYSRYKYALGLKDPEQKRLELAKAEKDITSTAALYPDLGGPAMKKKFQALLKTIQASLGKT